MDKPPPGDTTSSQGPQKRGGIQGPKNPPQKPLPTQVPVMKPQPAKPTKED